MTIDRPQVSGINNLAGVLGGAIASLGLFAACVVGFLWYREAAWPWTDRDPSHGWFHCVNESATPIAWGWRYRSLNEGLNYVGSHWSEGEQPAPDNWQTAGEVDSILPGAGEVVEVKIQFPESSGLPSTGTSFVATPGLHVRLRVASDHQASVAFGEATDIGFASFGPERPIGGP